MSILLGHPPRTRALLHTTSTPKPAARACGRRADPHCPRRAPAPTSNRQQQQIRAAAAHTPERPRRTGGHQSAHTAGLKNGRSRVRREEDYWLNGRVREYPSSGVAGGGGEQGPSLETQREARKSNPPKALLTRERNNAQEQERACARKCTTQGRALRPRAHKSPRGRGARQALHPHHEPCRKRRRINAIAQSPGVLGHRLSTPSSP
jgi:hypothetical protein